jgi:hypothetical protein
MRKIIKIIAFICFLCIPSFTFMCCAQNISEEYTDKNQQPVTELQNSSRSAYASSCSVGYGHDGI